MNRFHLSLKNKTHYYLEAARIEYNGFLFWHEHSGDDAWISSGIFIIKDEKFQDW
jgi:hypothetical protein